MGITLSPHLTFLNLEVAGTQQTQGGKKELELQLEKEVEQAKKVKHIYR